MWRLRPLLYPVILLVLGAWGIYENFIAPDPMWRFPKSEALAILSTVGAAIWLPFAIYRVARPLPVVVGSNVWFQDETKNIISGTVVSVDGGTVVINTPAGNYTRDRTDLTLGPAAKTAA